MLTRKVLLPHLAPTASRDSHPRPSDFQLQERAPNAPDAQAVYGAGQRTAIRITGKRKAPYIWQKINTPDKITP